MNTRLTVREMGLAGTHFIWECDLGHGDVLDLIQFFIEVGEGTDGPWLTVNDEPIVGAFGYISRKKYQSSVTERTNYRVRAVNLGRGGEETCSNVVPSYERPASKIGRYIAKQERKVLQRKIDVPMLHYARMHFGERCGCHDESGIQIIANVCGRCFGTGFRGGYYHPTLIFIARSQTNKGAEPTQFGVQENPMTECWTSNEAIIEPNDLLVNQWQQGERFVVKQVQATLMHGVIIRQTLTMQRVRQNDPEMLVPIEGKPANLSKDEIFRKSRGG